MRIFPLALIIIGVLGLLKHLGLIDPAMLHLVWPLLLIAFGVAWLVRGPRWRADLYERRLYRWERRMHRHFGPGWARLSEEERERFRAGMGQWQGRFRDQPRGCSAATESASDGGSAGPSAGTSNKPDMPR